MSDQSISFTDAESHDILAARREHNKFVPLFRLPFEVMASISLLAMLPLDLSIWKNPLLAVSSWWRSCVINTPQIWSCIHINGTTSADARFRCWLDRSRGACPLYLTVAAVDVFKATEASWADGDRGQDPSERIHSLSVDSSTNSSVFLFPLQFNTVNLHELVARFPPSSDHGPIRLFNNHPPENLKRLELRSLNYQPGLIDSVGITPSELTCLILAEEIDYNKVLALLEQSPKLVQLEWRPLVPSNLPAPDGLESIRRIPLHDLKRLVDYGHIRIFSSHPPANLRILELGNSGYQPGLIDSVGITPSELTSLVLAEEIDYNKVLILLVQSPKLIQLEWKLSISSNFYVLKDREGIHRVPLHNLKRLVFHGGESLLDILDIMETPNIRQMCLSGTWEDDQTSYLVALVSQCAMLRHLEFTNETSVFVSAEQVASLLHALPNLEYFDPEWRDSNIDGLIALCGESPGRITEEQDSSSQWACPMINRLYLPIDYLFRHNALSRTALASCLRRVLDVRAPPLAQWMDFVKSGADGLLLSGLSAPPRLTVVVDTDMATMSSIMGEPWSHWGGETVDSLEFPSTLL
ncbi:hypothetical protein DL93DRAFT_2155336 [Clavulina sp. PMI_390]|nr:hypothetical protein DL93DRAFT_2155336 [Clavulina sp. PMI_390]